MTQLKADPAFRLILIVVLTSSREEPDLLRCYELGANAYVVKPIDFHEFVDVIKQVGLFWAVVNQLPPGSLPAIAR